MNLPESEEIELSIVMPCLNEAETLGTCLKKAFEFLEKHQIKGEVLIGDNGSTDGSQKIAQAAGARIIDVKVRGYGAALYYGCSAAQGRYIIIGDSDDSYDFSRLEPFVEKLREGYELVMGNRFKGGIEDGAMPWKNRHIGSPVITATGKLFFGCKVGDFNCGMRGFTREAFHKMDLRTTGMEFASEMIIKASLFGFRVTEVPTTLSKDGRSRKPHLRPWRDGWRHLRFMALFSPRWLFAVPGLICLLPSLVLFLLLMRGSLDLGFVVLDYHTFLISILGIYAGVSFFMTGILVRMTGMYNGLLPQKPFIESLQRHPTLEYGLIGGLSLIIIGFFFFIRAFLQWQALDFGELSTDLVIRQIGMSILFTLLGLNLAVTSLVIGFLSIPTREDRDKQAAHSNVSTTQ